MLEDGLLSAQYFDSRGVHRVYGVSMSDGVLRMWRDEPGFSQRLDATVGDDAIVGVWELSRDGETWAEDLRITFRRAR